VKHFFATMLLAMAAVHPVNAQIKLPGIPKPNATQAAKPKEETPADIRKRLEQWQQEARETLARMEGENKAAPPVGITQAETDRRRRDLEQLVLATGSRIKGIDSIEDARKAATAARTALNQWTGFKEPPPYSVLMIDDLRDSRVNTDNRLDSHRASLDANDRMLKAAMADAGAAETALAAAVTQAEQAGPDKAAAARWRLEAERTRNRLLAVRIGYMEGVRDTLNEQIAATMAELTLLDRQIEIAAKHPRLGQQEFDHVEKITRERGAKLEREINEISRCLDQALDAAARARAEATAIQSQAAGTRDEKQAELAQLRLELAEARVMAQQTMTDTMSALAQFIRATPVAYRKRAVLMESTDPGEKAAALVALQDRYDLMRTFEWVLRTEREKADQALASLTTRIAFGNNDPRFQLLNEKRNVINELLQTLQRIDHGARPLRLFTLRWIREHTAGKGDAAGNGAIQRFSRLYSTLGSKLKDVWGIEISSYEKTFNIDGQTIVSRSPITLGSVIRALIFFAVSLWIASRVARRIQKSIVQRTHLGEAQTRMIHNWAMIVVAAILALTTLSYYGIPLTVFAFFGGALAIGVGFGMQTIFKNFISGIIVLIERRVRVGDFVDVDGTFGTVTEINTRSSIIRSPDDVETMVPNSMFLENRITNRTLTHRRVRRSIRVGVAYGSDPKTVMDILTDSANRHGLVCKDPTPFAVFEDFGDSSLVFMLYYWVNIDSSTNPGVVASDLRIMIDKRLSAAGLGVPFPQRDARLITDKPIRVELGDFRNSNSNSADESPEPPTGRS
jgi:small-conductance mechanosensitive channel